MILITVPISTPNEAVIRLRDRLDHLVKYHPDYAGHKFEIQKSHISLVNIKGEAPRELIAHLQEVLREHMI